MNNWNYFAVMLKSQSEHAVWMHISCKFCEQKYFLLFPVRLIYISYTTQGVKQTDVQMIKQLIPILTNLCNISVGPAPDSAIFKKKQKTTGQARG